MSETTPDLLIHDLSELASPAGEGFSTGAAQGAVERLRGVDVVCREGRIAFVGSGDERRRRFPALDAEVAAGTAVALDGRGRTLIPGFVDCHTHLPWAGRRADELMRRLGGESYQEIAAAGGGILSTVAATRAAEEDLLAANVERRLDAMLAHGTTTAEVKSGYGLSLEHEAKQLRAVRRAASSHAVRVLPTLLAAHEFPPEHRDDRDRWVDLIVDEVVPAIAEEGLARFCDVFCERGVFDVEQSRRVLESGRRHGLVPRLHADEFVDSGGAELAAELGAASADHLVAVSEAGIAAMAATGVAAVGLPGVAFFLRKDEAVPARRLIEANVPFVLATDCNPGSSHTVSIPFIVQLGVFRLGLSIDEALVAVTANAAAVLGLAGEVGRITEGRIADLVLVDGPELEELAYRLGANPVAAVVRAGRVAHRAAFEQRMAV
ncbi:MAG: imidazolonepropionase [Acidobacteriota bacterium]